jgi:hypothetical protein
MASDGILGRSLLGPEPIPIGAGSFMTTEEKLMSEMTMHELVSDTSPDRSYTKQIATFPRVHTSLSSICRVSTRVYHLIAAV